VSDKKDATESVSESENPVIPSPTPTRTRPRTNGTGGRISRTCRFSTSTRLGPIRWVRTSTTQRSSSPSTSMR
jgi:hypothetical protein